MKSEEFCRILNEIDDDYIIKAHEERKNPKVIPIKKIITLVACLVLLAVLATVVTAKPEYRIWFEKNDFDGEIGYYAFAELEKFPLSDFSENLDIISDEIVQQFDTYEFYMSSTPGHWYRYYDTFEEAKEAIDFDGFYLPDWKIKVKYASLHANGDRTGNVSATGMSVFYGGEVMADIFAWALTENYEEEAFQFDVIDENQYESIRKIENKKGTDFYIIGGGESLNGNIITKIFFIKGGVLYYVNFAYGEGCEEKANELITALMESY